VTKHAAKVIGMQHAQQSTKSMRAWLDKMVVTFEENDKEGDRKWVVVAADAATYKYLVSTTAREAKDQEKYTPHVALLLGGLHENKNNLELVHKLLLSKYFGGGFAGCHAIHLSPIPTHDHCC
jgi:hypothetical protein